MADGSSTSYFSALEPRALILEELPFLHVLGRLSAVLPKMPTEGVTTTTKIPSTRMRQVLKEFSCVCLPMPSRSFTSSSAYPEDISRNGNIETYSEWDRFMPRLGRDLPVYVGVFLISLATLVLEVTLTRILSVSKWYYFAFMVVSLALFGTGASGSFLSIFHTVLEGDINRLLVILSGFFSVSCVGSLALMNLIPFDPFRFAFDPMQILHLLGYYVVLAVPFFFSGLSVGAVFSKITRKTNRIYFSNLVGSGLGSLVVVTVFSSLSGSMIIILASLFGLLSILFFAQRFSKRRFYSIAVCVLVLSTLFIGIQPFLEPNISPYKSLKIALTYPGAQVLYTGWNAFSRVDVIESPYVRYAPGLSYEYRKQIPPQLGITVDGDGLNAITSFNGNLTNLEFTGYLPMSLAYRFKENQKVLIVDAAGGLDVLTALYNGATSVVAVETNPIIIALVRDRYKIFSGGIYEEERVRVEISDGRSFVRKSSDRYDVIQIPLTGGVATSSTGIYALTENYLYTTEAFEDFYTHLTEDGVLSVTRWLLPPPREDLRMVSLAISVLEKQRVEPKEHMAVIRSLNTITLLLKRNGFNSKDVSEIRKFCSERRFDLVHIPGMAASEANQYNKFPEDYYYQMVHSLLYSEDRTRIYGGYLFDVSPVTDERPFFFHFLKWDRILETYESVGKKWQPFVEGGYMVPLVFAQALFLSLVFILLPVHRFRRFGDIRERWRILVYFLCLGFGYMLIEITLMQKFILFLGHPIYAVSIVLFSLLTFSGVGGLISGKFEERKVLTLAIPILSIIILLYLIALPTFFHILLGQDTTVRVLISCIVMIPLSILAGMPFPAGIRMTSVSHRDLIPWAWSVNGCASVLGSILPMMIALSFGFSVVLLLASVFYLAALAVVFSELSRIERGSGK